MTAKQPTSKQFRVINLISVVVLLSLASVAKADDAVVGTWNLKYRVGNRDIDAKLSISKNDDGSFDGQWTSKPGSSEISDLKFESGKLTFVRKLRLNERDIRVTFAGKIQGNRVTGTLSSQLGNFAVSGTRVQPRAARKQETRKKNARTRPSKRSPTHQNVKYGPYERNVLDFWRAESAAPTPLVVYIHGGGFRAGSKNSLNARTLQQLLDAGISVAAINYRLIAQAPLPAAHFDSRRALQFLRSKAKSWNIESLMVKSPMLLWPPDRKSTRVLNSQSEIDNPR